MERFQIWRNITDYSTTPTSCLLAHRLLYEGKAAEEGKYDAENVVEVEEAYDGEQEEAGQECEAGEKEECPCASARFAQTVLTSVPARARALLKQF